MGLSNIILEPTEEDEEYVESFFNVDEKEQEIEYNNYCLENYV